ncbi:MAG: type II toxin-antitoxin system PemK/MazF family toxin [Propionibacteriaceae bacterium]|jgi:mRNA interferase MazF|nr:type II toxin-antitoxin system PemK/MazF family toxin [Propionibacteriaceae bacterium]
MTGEINRGDLIWASLDPVQGREQAKHRPHLVLSDRRFHRARKLVITVPLTTAEKPWPTRVRVAEGSWAVCEQPRTLSIERITRVEHRSYDTTHVQRIVSYLMGGPVPTQEIYGS